MVPNLKQQITLYAQSLGFDRVGFTSAEPLSRAEPLFAEWLAEGRAGEMDYLEKAPTRRTRPSGHVPGAKSVIALAVNYNPEKWIGSSVGRRSGKMPIDTHPPTNGPTDPLQNEGRISRYAWGKDYHKVIGKKLEALVRYLESLEPGSTAKSFVDTGALLERPFAQRAGLGFIGKNTMLITKGLGSWVFLANVITTLELLPDSPDSRSCGDCTICIDACPTSAITAPYELDPRRCISYLTIESEGGTRGDLREKSQNWVFGCDICQEVCPHNTRVPQTREPAFEGRMTRSGTVSLKEILELGSDEAFRRQFGGTPLMRAGRSGLLRNACVAAANLGRTDLVPAIRRLLEKEENVSVQEHATWALGQLEVKGFSSDQTIGQPSESERVP